MNAGAILGWSQVSYPDYVTSNDYKLFRLRRDPIILVGLSSILDYYIMLLVLKVVSVALFKSRNCAAMVPVHYLSIRHLDVDQQEDY